MDKKIFLTRRYSNDIYKLIIDVCLKDATKNVNNNLNIEVITIQKRPNFYFLIYCICIFFFGFFFNKKKIINLKYKNIRFGKYLIAQTYRKYGTYISNFKFYSSLLKNIYICSLNIETAYFYLKKYNFDEVYLDHCEYLNGIFYDIFYEKNKIIYSNHYPKNIFKVIPNKKKNFFRRLSENKIS